MQLKAKDISKKAIKVEPSRTVYDARNLMLRYNISRIVVAEGSNALGMVTEKDIGRFLLRGVGRKLEEVRIDEVMTKYLITVNEETKLSDCAKLMLEKGISSLIVVDGSGALSGIFTKRDLVNVYATYYEGKHLVKDYMSREVLTVSPDDTSAAVLAVMTEKKISRVVVASDNRPVGIVTGSDFLNIGAYGRNVYQVVKEPIGDTYVVQSTIRKLLLAKDLIRREPIIVLQDADLADAAQIMMNNRISGLPVVDSSSELVGIITSTDVARALAES